MINFMNLFEIQNKLDNEIIKRNNIEQDTLIEERYLALLVEIGEMANETRCFKFWSAKKPSSKEVTLEEYVDCMHFILSIGNYFKHYKVFDQISLDINPAMNLNDTIIELFHAVVRFRDNPAISYYVDIWEIFLEIGILLGYTEKEIEEAYLRKNEINHQRQENGY